MELLEIIPEEEYTKEEIRQIAAEANPLSKLDFSNKRL